MFWLCGGGGDGTCARTAHVRTAHVLNGSRTSFAHTISHVLAKHTHALNCCTRSTTVTRIWPTDFDACPSSTRSTHTHFDCTRDLFGTEQVHLNYIHRLGGHAHTLHRFNARRHSLCTQSTRERTCVLFVDRSTCSTSWSIIICTTIRHCTGATRPRRRITTTRGFRRRRGAAA